MAWSFTGTCCDLLVFRSSIVLQVLRRNVRIVKRKMQRSCASEGNLPAGANQNANSLAQLLVKMLIANHLCAPPYYMRMTRDEFRKQLESVVDEAANLDMNWLLRRQLSDLVGDPAKHPPTSYYEHVNAIANRFHAAHREATRAVRESGHRDKYAALYIEIARGLWSLACLRFAGALYRCHIVAVVDVRTHQARVETVIRTLPAFA